MSKAGDHEPEYPSLDTAGKFISSPTQIGGIGSKEGIVNSFTKTSTSSLAIHPLPKSIETVYVLFPVLGTIVSPISVEPVDHNKSPI